MSLPILQASTNQTTHVRGDVMIDSSVMIAVGVILNATPGNKIIIHSGVCLGMGTVITAHDGDVEIKPNAILGAGCLIFGHCIIGSQASLGSSVTVYNVNVDAGDVIPAGSIRGDRTRKIELNSQENSNSVAENKVQENKWSNKSAKSEENKQNTTNNQEERESKAESISEKPEQIKQENQDISHENLEQEEEIKTDSWQEDTPPNSEQVVGKVYINKLLFTLFPERNM
ncbi:hypothetical protein WEU38_08640 [Cyanobacterium aponinum AL20118]|uniref:Transferase n=1 Tax=Cyanobacterium aponinum AL20115 TaxID=3090662 RepID=A0AAF1C6H8_9CHRO|nr:hypothetical protein [Cyanobacterium aponinum]PHV62144.1 hypothetical protein CSQ80_11750 [Cyanobacterium aponinum IPPAS B-1201]WPF90325.1 hypothetical protein SAY89_08660 [Cyanobacterium aponinum AL20115]